MVTANVFGMINVLSHYGTRACTLTRTRMIHACNARITRAYCTLHHTHA